MKSRSVRFIAYVLAFLLPVAIVQVVTSHPASPARDQAVLASSPGPQPWRMTGWGGWTGPTTTTTTPPPPPTTVAPRPVARPARARRAPVPGANTGDFAACVRQHESGNNYAYDGYYKGAYNMTTSHWGGYGGYSNPADAPPSVQDAKFQSDVAQGSAYMHQQYPTTSRMCGG